MLLCLYQGAVELKMMIRQGMWNIHVLNATYRFWPCFLFVLDKFGLGAICFTAALVFSTTKKLVKSVPDDGRELRKDRVARIILQK